MLSDEELNQMLRDYITMGMDSVTPIIRELIAARALLASEPAPVELPITEEWLRAVGFKTKQYQRDTVLALKFASDIGDEQWIETSTDYLEFLLCRWSELYDDDTPPDRVSVNVSTRQQLRQLCAALGVQLKDGDA